MLHGTGRSAGPARLGALPKSQTLEAKHASPRRQISMSELRPSRTAMSETLVSAQREKLLNETPRASGGVADLRGLIRSLAGYREPNHGRSIVEIVITLVPFVLL